MHAHPEETRPVPEPIGTFTQAYVLQLVDDEGRVIPLGDLLIEFPVVLDAHKRPTLADPGPLIADALAAAAEGMRHDLAREEAARA